ncbi:beta-agarase [Flavobacterium sp. NG2]|uniref:beta-agarase n=1 Tax=Flavobacterium sp. NG2 TaxID=3097547 RepID=UPI002A82C59A|nr:beta-agarase [Flavobacterium sp. NG2]WPR73113.1 beta-agarase [Flavobacterium sp. NG2]
MNYCKLSQTILLGLFFLSSNAQQQAKSLNLESKSNEDIRTLALPSYLQKEGDWEFQANVSDDFNYKYSETNAKTNFGKNKWVNFYYSNWDGPGTTYWKYNHVAVDGNDLIIKSSRRNKATEFNPIFSKADKMNKPDGGINAGCISSIDKVSFPVFIESKVSVANIALASDVWLLSPDATQEIDIIECYGGKGSGNAFFAKSIHLSHHSFIRKPFTDYQPRDKGAWYERKGVEAWGDYCWNNGDREYVRVGVYWKSAFHFEYYIDGELVRVLYDKSLATKRNGKWEYGYPTMTDGKLDVEAGKQKIINFSTTENYSFEELQKANAVSKVSIIDPNHYQNGNGYTKELNIIINMESQDWHVAAGRTPSDADLADDTKNTVKVDWIRVFKPKSSDK